MTAVAAAPARTARRSAAVGAAAIRNLGPRVFLLFLIAFLFLPLFVVVLFSFNATASLSFPIPGFSSRWYDKVLDDREVVAALGRSAIAAFVTGDRGGRDRHPRRARHPGPAAALEGRRPDDRADPDRDARRCCSRSASRSTSTGWASSRRGCRWRSPGHILLALPFVLLTMTAAARPVPVLAARGGARPGCQPDSRLLDDHVPARPAGGAGRDPARGRGLHRRVHHRVLQHRLATARCRCVIYARIRRVIDPGLNALATILLVATTLLAVLAARHHDGPAMSPRCRRAGPDRHPVRGRQQVLRQVPGRPRPRPRDPRGRVLLAARPVRLRQDDVAADARRASRTPTRGGSCCAARDVTYLPPNKRPVNMVFQHYELFPHMTVFGNVALRPQAQEGARAGADRGACTRCCGSSASTASRDAGARQLSGGQQQRVALARALVNRPAVLLLDEPLSALDVKLRKQMQIELKAIQHQLGTTFVYVTHDQEEALLMSDRIGIMNHGRLLQVGTPREIYEQPGGRVRGRLRGLAQRVRAAGRRDRRRPRAHAGGRGPAGRGRARRHRRDGGLDAARGGPPRTRAHHRRRCCGRGAARARARGSAASSGAVDYVGSLTTYRVDTDLGAIAVQEANDTPAPDFEVGDRVVLEWAPDAAFVLPESAPGLPPAG